MLRFLTAGESHGQALIAILDGLPAGLSIDASDINLDLGRRQKGYGRGGRMKIEKDEVQILSGVRFGKTLGSPLGLLIENKDWENWKQNMAVEGQEPEHHVVEKPRPGHADFAGALKYGHDDIRNVLERASARETTARVAAGAVCKKFLGEFGIRVYSWVVQIGAARWESRETLKCFSEKDFERLFLQTEASHVRCPDEKASGQMMKLIDGAKEQGDTLGGVFEVVVCRAPVGLGSHVQWDRKLDGLLARALLSVQAIKGVEVGLGFEVGGRLGSEAHDEIFYDEKDRKFYRTTNHAGGLEGGMTNGEPLIVRAAMKPLSTLRKPLQSVNMRTKEAQISHFERSDVCAVPAAAVIGEAVAAYEIAGAFLEKFGGDYMDETLRNFKAYQDDLKHRCE